MATIQQSIDVRVPAHTAYNRLTQFEEYPRFMEEVDTVQQLDDTHLHWTTRMSNRPVEWDAEITEREPDRSIAWRNASGPMNTGRLEVQALGSDASRVIFTLESRPGPEQVPGSPASDSELEMVRRLKLDLARLKEFIESRGQGGASSQPAEPQGDRRNSPAPTSSYAAGSEGFAGDEEPTAPVTSATRTAAEQRNDSAGSVSPQQTAGRAPSAPESQRSQQAGAGNAVGGAGTTAGTQGTSGKGEASKP